MSPLTVSDRSYISDNAFKEADLVKTEKLILETLNYELCYVTPIHFVHFFYVKGEPELTKLIRHTVIVKQQTQNKRGFYRLSNML